jgi:hypothetical protein
MNRLPQLVETHKQTLMTTTFMGYNHREIIQDGEMYNTRNLSGDLFPLLAPRKARGVMLPDIADPSDTPQGINGRECLTLILGSKVFYNFHQIYDLSVSTDPSMKPKKIVNFGAYVCIWPDKVYFNTINLAENGSMERLWEGNGRDLTMMLCRGDGTDYDMTDIAVGETEPLSPDNGDLWIDQSGASDVLRQYVSYSEEWTEVATTYVKIQGSGIGHGLKMYDAIDLSGLEAPDVSSERLKEDVKTLNGSTLVYQCGENYIVIAGLISASMNFLKDADVRADLKVPDLDHIIESNNRLWGCKYGYTDGKVTNEIKASALGDFRNWNRYLSNSQDSYTVNVGSDGGFTGAANLQGHPVFFKENYIHQIYGNTPSSFQINTTPCRGVQNGSDRSIAVINEQVYYKSRTDVMVFDGSMPKAISSQLGDVWYGSARAGVLGNKYYISMKDDGGRWNLFTYDTAKDIWFREDEFHALGFGHVGDELYAINEDTGELMTVNGSKGQVEDHIDWEAEFGIFGTDYRAKKYLSRFDIRMYLEEGTSAKLEIMYDSTGDWQELGTIRGSRLRSFTMPIIPRRCDHLRLRMSGNGDMRVYSISRILEVGTDA